MDIFAHTLWTNVVFYKKYKNELRNRFIAVAFGILPDLVSFTPIFIYSFFTKIDFFDLIGRNVWVVRYASESYNYTHSIVIFIITTLIIALLRFLWFKYKRNVILNYFKPKSLLYWPMFGWLLHILIDIPTHRGFYETPFLFPLSKSTFSHGISWAHPVFMVINYSILAIIYVFWFLVLRKQK